MNGGTTSTLAARTRVARYLIALSVVLGGIGVLLLGDPRVCRQELPAQGTKAAEVCAPPAATDTATLAVLAAVLLLLAPDLSEAGIAGVTLKRAVEEAKAEAATARADAAAVRLSVTQLHQHAAATSTAQATTVVQSGEAGLIEALAKIGLLRGVPPTRGAAPARAAPGQESVVDTMRALLVSEQVERARDLLPERWRPGTFVGIAGELTVLAGPDLPEALLERVLTAPDGAVARSLRGEYAATPAAADVPAVIAAPIWGGADALGAVAVVLPPDAPPATSRDAVDLAPAAFLFSAGLRPGGVPPASPGPAVDEEAP